jgi:hypothetical protein
MNSKVENNQLILPGGMSYKMMVLPPLETITPELLQKIKELVNEGLVILGPKPNRSPSLKNYPLADAKVKDLADELWGAGQSNRPVSEVGKGKVFCGIEMQEALNQIGLAKDVDFPADKPLLFTHRSNGEQDIYFITNQSDSVVDVSAVFRTTNKHPELWDATNGSMRN